MAQQTISVNATASLTARGTTQASGTISWTAPALPDGVANWDSVTISGTWSWGGKGSISRVTINGTNTSNGVPFEVSVAGKTSPLSITCVGNKNATGTSFTWSNLQVNYVYTELVTEKTTLYVQLNGSPVEVQTVYKKINGAWVEQTDLSSLFDASANYVKMN